MANEMRTSVALINPRIGPMRPGIYPPASPEMTATSIPPGNSRVEPP